jgi:hypothetical protein
MPVNGRSATRSIPSTRIGALVSEGAFRQGCAATWWADVKVGCIWAESPTRAPMFVEPTVMDVRARRCGQAREEIFGPVLSVMTRRKSFDEAIALANDTELRARGLDLHCQRETGAEGRADADPGRHSDREQLRRGRHHHALRRLQDNRASAGVTTGIHAHDQYTLVKTIWVDLADDDGRGGGIDATRPGARPCTAAGRRWNAILGPGAGANPSLEADATADFADRRRRLRRALGSPPPHPDGAPAPGSRCWRRGASPRGHGGAQLGLHDRSAA